METLFNPAKNNNDTDLAFHVDPAQNRAIRTTISSSVESIHIKRRPIYFLNVASVLALLHFLPASSKSNHFISQIPSKSVTNYLKSIPLLVIDLAVKGNRSIVITISRAVVI